MRCLEAVVVDSEGEVPDPVVRTPSQKGLVPALPLDQRLTLTADGLATFCFPTGSFKRLNKCLLNRILLLYLLD